MGGVGGGGVGGGGGRPLVIEDSGLRIGDSGLKPDSVGRRLTLWVGAIGWT